MEKAVADISPEQRAAIEAKREEEYQDDDDDELVQWAEKLTKAYGKAVAGFVKVGRLLIQAKQELGPGRFGELWNGDEYALPFGWRQANKFMSIADNKVLTDSTHESKLPTSVETLYILSRIPEEKLRKLISSGKVHTNLTRQQAKRLAGDIPARLVAAIEVLIEAMRENDDDSELDALAVEVTEVLYEKDEHWSWWRHQRPSSYRLIDDPDDQWGRSPLRRLNQLSAWITKFIQACARSDAEQGEEHNASKRKR